MPWTTVSGSRTSECNDSDVAVVKEDAQGEPMLDEVEGCHETEEDANEQIAALEASENAFDEVLDILDTKDMDDTEEPEYKSAAGETRTLAYETKEFEVKADDEDEFKFEAYGAVFGNKDRGGDIIEKGAFKRTIDHNDGKFPLIADHDFKMKSRLGVVYTKEDRNGVFTEGHVNTNTQMGREVASHIRHAQKHDLPVGMSFGYEVVKDDYDEEKDARLLKEVKAHEFTVTQIPMNGQARVQGVKHLLDDDDALETLAKQVATLLASDADLRSTLTEALGRKDESDSDSHSDVSGLADEIQSLTNDIRTNE